MEQKIYRVYGEDTFAHETFMVAEFNNREAAEAKLAECRASVMHQTESLRDEFWIVDCTPKQVEEANRKEAEEREARRKAREYDHEMLEADVDVLLCLVKSQLQDENTLEEFLLDDKQHYAEATVTNPSSEVKHHKIVMYVDFYAKDNGNANIEVYIGGCKASGAIKFFHSEDEMLDWFASSESIKETIAKVEELIKIVLED